MGHRTVNVWHGTDAVTTWGRFFLGLFSAQQMQCLGYYAPGVLLTAGLVLGIDWFASGREWPAVPSQPEDQP